MRVSQVSSVFWYSTSHITFESDIGSRFLEHFPKPGTKAEARMIALDDKNIEETDDSEDDEEEGKQEVQTDKNGKPKSKTTRE